MRHALNLSIVRGAVYLAAFFFALGVGLAAARIQVPSESASPVPEFRSNVISTTSIDTTTISEAITELSFSGDSSLFGVGIFAGLQRSNDLGKTWTKVEVDTGGWSLGHVDFVDDQVGWAAGDTVLVKTEDGGATWTRSKLPGWLHNADIDFVDRSVGYLAAGDCHGKDNQSCIGNVILKTVDGGKTWRKVYSDSSSFTVFQLKAIDKDTVFVLNNADSLRRTIDGGATWEVTYKNRNAAYQIAASPDGVIWLAGEGSLMRSDDNGMTWKHPELPPGFLDENWHAIEFSPAGVGVVASDGSCVGITLDSGRAWSRNCSPMIAFGLMFDISIQGDRAVIASSSDTSHDSISLLLIH